jgi:hypothetical protein
LDPLPTDDDVSVSQPNRTSGTASLVGVYFLAITQPSSFYSICIERFGSGGFGGSPMLASVAN